MRTEPLVSVVMPAHNAAADIDSAIVDVLAENYRHLELAVVDDGSDDDTAEHVRAVTDQRVRLVQVRPNAR